MRSSLTTHRRHGPALRVAAVLAAGSLALAACGQAENTEDAGADDDAGTEEPADAGDGSEATIRFAWWGADTRHQKMQTIIDGFTAEHPDITVTPDYTDWAGYWDKLATQTAGGDTPDVMMQEDRYLGEYADRDVLADLSEYDIDTADIDTTLLESGEFDDGQWGIPTGSNIYAIHANPRLFQEAGVEMPDDTTWTWQDYVDISNQITQATEEGVYGTSDYSFNEVGFMVYVRQHGQSFYDEDGSLGYDDELLEEWFQRSLDLQESGGQPPADETVGLDVGETPIATNKAAMGMTWSAQLAANAAVSGDDLQLLRIPGESEHERSGMYFKPGMYVSMSAESAHPEAAATFIDYFVNSVDVGEVVLAELGLPGNAEVREAISGQLGEVDQTVAAFTEEVGPDIVDAPPPMPVGAGEVAGIMMRMNEAVLFGQLTPQEAAAQFRTEAEAAIG